MTTFPARGVVSGAMKFMAPMHVAEVGSGLGISGGRPMGFGHQVLLSGLSHEAHSDDLIETALA